MVLTMLYLADQPLALVNYQVEIIILLAAVEREATSQAVLTQLLDSAAEV